MYAKLYLFRSKAFALIFISTFFLNACAGLTNKNSTISDSKPIWSYGNFCGSGYPKNSNGIHPIDDLDLICAYHDKCYDSFGRAHQVCDELMSRNLSYFIDQSKKTTLTNRCGAVIVEAFTFAQSNIANDQNFFLKAITVFERTLQAPYLALLSALLSHGTSNDNRPCNLDNPNVEYVAPISKHELTRLNQCEKKHAEIKNYSRDYPNSYDHKVWQALQREKTDRIGRGRDFNTNAEYDKKFGCTDYPVRGRF